MNVDIITDTKLVLLFSRKRAGPICRGQQNWVMPIRKSRLSWKIRNEKLSKKKNQSNFQRIQRYISNKKIVLLFWTFAYRYRTHLLFFFFAKSINMIKINIPMGSYRIPKALYKEWPRIRMFFHFRKCRFQNECVCLKVLFYCFFVGGITIHKIGIKVMLDQIPNRWES